MKINGIPNENSLLSTAFLKLRENTTLSESEKYALTTFTDMFITCSLDPNILDETTIQIAQMLISIIIPRNVKNI